MTPQEQGMINGLIDRVQKTQLAEKDADAEHLLQGSLGRNPDALYILSQTVLVQQYALDQAQAQLTSLKSQMEQMQAQQQHPKPATSFLGGLFGGGSSEHSAPPPPQQAVQSGSQYAPVPGYPAQGGYAQPGYAAQPAYGSPQYAAQPQGGGFLRGAAQTAAGVAAGALAFEGVESLMHGFGSSVTGMGGGGRPEEIVNNYYGDDARGDGGRGSQFDDDRSRDNNDPGSNVFTDDGDRNNFAATGDDTSTDDGDTGDFNDTSDSDGSNFDDGGSDSMSDDSSSDNSF